MARETIQSFDFEENAETEHRFFKRQGYEFFFVFFFLITGLIIYRSFLLAEALGELDERLL
jgi:hypothetical protein